MKNKFLPLLMLLCFAWFGGARAAIVEIGNGTTTQNSFPIKTDWTYSLTQQIFTAEEIGTEGTINAISFHYANTDAFSIPDIQVYMKNVEKNSFTNDRDMVQVYPSDKVWEGTYSATGEGWITISLDTPFEYDGTSNLLVCFYCPTNGYLGTTGNVFYYTSTTDYLSIAYYSYDFIPDINNVNTYSGAGWYQDGFRANVRFDITPVVIGDPASTTTQYTLPVNMYYNYSLTQQIFTAEEIGTAGTINFIAFDYAYSNSFSMENVQVYMKNVNKETFESNTDMVAISSSDKVWEGTFAATGMGWVTLTLDTPFEYDGNSNLLVCFYDPTSGYPGYDWKFRTTATTDHQAIAYYHDNANYIPNLNDLSSYNGYKNYYLYRNNIQIGISPDPNWVPCEKPQNLVASVYQEQYYAAWLGWTGGSGSFNVEYKKTTETNWIRYKTNIGYNCLLSPLEENTEYQIRVQSVCGTSTSGWTTISYTTPFACNPVSNLHLTSLSHTAASILWDAPESGCNCRLEWKKSSASDWIVHDHIGCGAGFGPGLDSNTSYDVRVLQYCNNGYQSDWEEISFTTLPAPMTVPFLEEFSNSTIPADWTRYTGILYDVMNGAALQTSSYGWDFGTKNGAFNNSPHAYLNIYGTGRKHWLVTPLVNLVQDCLLSFDVAYTAYNGNMGNPDQSGTDDKFVVLVSTNGGISWQILRQWDNQGSEYVLNNLTPNGETVELDLAAYTGNVVQLAFYGESTITNADNDLHIDNVSIDLKPLCWDMKVNEITLSNITPHAVTIGWDVNGGATAWDIQCSSAPDFQSDLHEIGLTDYYSSWTFNNLAPETLYYVRIAPDCPQGNYEPWSDVVTFTTPEACPVPTDVTVTDVTPHGFTASFTPGGDWQNSWYFAWTTENVAPISAPGNTSVTEFGVSNNLNIFAGTTYYLWVGIYCEEANTYVWGEPAQFTTPMACSTTVDAQDVEIDDVQPHEVSLDWSDSPATAEQWQVCYSIYNMLPPESSMSENAVIVDGKYATIDGLAPDLEYHFWIRALCDVWNGTPEWGEWSDMITVQTEVSCFPPLNVTVSNITSTTATISWDPNPSTVVPVEYYEVNIESDDWGDPYVAMVTQPYFELDLDGWVDEGEDLPCTVYVHAYCGQGEGLSEASETVGFMLTDKEQLTVNDGTNANSFVPIYGLWVDKYSKSQFIIPAEDIEDMEYSQISWMTFYAGNNYIDWGNAKFEVYMMELPCGETEFASATLYDWDDMEKVYYEGRLDIRNGQMIVEFDEPFFYNGGNLLIGFKQTVSGTYKSCTWYGVNQTSNTAIGGYENSKGIGLRQFLPKVSFLYDPTTSAVCRKPKDFTIEAVPSEAGTVEFSWTPTDENDQVWIAWGFSDFDPNDPSTWEGSTITQYNPGWMGGFEPETTYYFAARTVCNQGQGVYSNWTCPFSLTMPEACPTPTNVTVTDNTSTQATVQWVDYGDTWLTLYKPVSDETYGFETNTLEGWTSEGDGTWAVGTGDGNDDEPISAHSGNYNVMITHSSEGNETWLISPTMNLSGLSTAYVEFWYINRDWGGDVDELGVYYRIDGGAWQLLESYTDAHEAWTPKRIYLEPFADNYQIGFKMTDNYGYGVGLDDINIYMEQYKGGYLVSYPDQSVTFTNLEPSTTYWFSLSADCDGINSHGVGPIYFTTKCEAILVDADNPFSEDFEGGTFAPNCWDNIPSGSNQWNSSFTYSHSSSHSAYSSYYGNIYLVMPELQLASNASEASLSFWSYNTYPDDFDAGNNAVVLLDGDTETMLWSAGTVNESWEETTIDLTAYLGQNITLAFKYAGNDGNGWYVDDVEVSVTPPTTVTQTIALAAGWNWVSFNVEITMDDLKAAINAVALTGDRPIIRSQNNGQTQKRGNNNNWMGALTELDLSQMYKIQIGAACEITLEGEPINPADHPATIVNGANWIAYPLSESMTVANAFSNYTPTIGDEVSSQNNGKATRRGTNWMGALQNLVPGQGYIYKSKATGSNPLVFPVPAKK